MANSLITNLYKVNLINDLIDDISSNNNLYYIFTSNPVSVSNTINEDVNDTEISPFNNMQYGKLINSKNIYPVILNYPWTSNTIYSKYDHTDANLSSKQFYSIVNTGNNYYVWKCLDNNLGSPSTIYPNYSDLTSSDDTYQTSDGYIWKYMYSVNNSIASQFSSYNYFPVSFDANVVNSAKAGSIYAFNVSNVGYGYSNYLMGTFSISDIQLGGNSNIYSISNTASLSNTYYNGCMIYISSGTGAGQYRTITYSGANNTNKYIVLNSPFNPVPQNGSQYEIYPMVSLDNFNNTTNCIARAIISPAGNTVQRIEILDSGSGYQFNSINSYVNASNSVGVTLPATIYPILSPKNGHGYNPMEELYCNSLSIAISFNGTEGNTIPCNNNIYTIGIIKNPVFSNVQVLVSNLVGTYTTNEPISQVNLVQFNYTANVSIGNKTITSMNGNFINQLTTNSYVYISGNGNPLLSEVTSVINSSSFTINNSPYFSSTSSNLYFVNFTANATLSNHNSNQLTLNNLNSPITSNNILIGINSFAISTINTISINNLTNYNFNTFVGLYAYNVSNVSGAFIENEILNDSNTVNYSALVHSTSIYGNNTIIYVYNPVGIFNSGDNILGKNSKATAKIASIYKPFINYNSGDILYIQNISPINKDQNSNNFFNIIFNF